MRSTKVPPVAVPAEETNGKKAKVALIELPPLKIETLRLTLVGDSPLISHRWDDKAKEMMLAKQMKKGKQGKDAKDPFRDFAESLYWFSEKPAKPTPEDVRAAKFCMPTIQFKLAAVNACSHIDGVTKVEARGTFHVVGEFVEIESDPPTMREDMVRIAMGTADIRYRGEFKQWRTTLTIRYNGNGLSPEQIVNLFNTAGFAVGVGEWRPQRGGSYGMFHVASGEEVA